MKRIRSHVASAVLSATAAFCLAGSPSAHAQGPPPAITEVAPNGALVTLPVPTPTPAIPDQNQRSGLITRSTPIVPNLPYDKRRDQYFNTRWANSPVMKYPNYPCTSGLYGLRWGTPCTACFSPYFTGSPGTSTIGPDCARPRFRVLTNFVHPFKPVCHYYANGCYVPVYDLDPTVPGPGPFPIGVFWRRCLGG